MIVAQCVAHNFLMDVWFIDLMLYQAMVSIRTQLNPFALNSWGTNSCLIVAIGMLRDFRCREMSLAYMQIKRFREERSRKKVSHCRDGTYRAPVFKQVVLWSGDVSPTGMLSLFL